jgi:DNA topoisomerase VI subunit B
MANDRAGKPIEELDPKNFRGKTDLLERTRALDYVTIQGLSTLTGCDVSSLDVMCIKELVDNGLDAGGRLIDISIKAEGEFLSLSVSDDGEGLTPSNVERITDYTKLFSSKYYNMVPSRGVLGNAFKILMGAPYALAAERELVFSNSPVVLRSGGKMYRIELEIDYLRERVIPRIEVSEAEIDDTEVCLLLPLYGDRWGWKGEYVDLIQGFALFNPQASFRLDIDRGEDRHFSKDYSAAVDESNTFKGRASVHWYRESDFKQFVWAKIRSINRDNEDEPLRSFIGEFRGLSSYKRIKSVLKEAEIKESFNVTDLSGREDLIAALFEAMRSSLEPSPRVLGNVGEEGMKGRIFQFIGEIEEFKYRRESGFHDDGSARTPYVIETAVAALPKKSNSGRRIFVGINHSPCLHGNPFDRCSLEWSSKGEVKRGYGVRGLIEKYGIDKDAPVVVIIHLISPRVEFTNYGKSEINSEPFKKSLAQTLYKTCRFYHHYKRGGSNRKPSQKSRARLFLIEELERRNEILRLKGSVPDSNRTTMQGLYYKIRKIMGGETSIKRDSFISAISTECEVLGRKREELGIVAAVRAEMYFRGEVYPVSYDKVEMLAQMGSDILLIEKEGIALALEPYARRSGVALINSRGFAVEYAKDLLYLSQNYEANVFLLTDMDASGLLISVKVADIPRIGVDMSTLSQLRIHFSDVAERYTPPQKHLKALPPEMLDLVKIFRIEIDSVLAEVGPDLLWKHLEAKMLKLAPVRDLTRSIEILINLPAMITKPIDELCDVIRSLGRDSQKHIQSNLRRWEGGFPNVPEMEGQLQADIMNNISKDPRVDELSEDLRALVDTYHKKFSEFRE